MSDQDELWTDRVASLQICSPNITVWSDTKYPWPKNRLQRKQTQARAETVCILTYLCVDGCD